ncbi:MAG: hypothetical protein ACYDDI_12490 [Candidatus Acidiferrales bacterium]
MPRRKKDTNGRGLQDSAAKIFGVTTEIADTAYVLRDGRGVCFSTMQDHTEIFLAFPGRERERLREAMDSELDISTSVFLKRTGAVRIALRDGREASDSLYVHIDARHPPTVAQMRRLREAVQLLQGERVLVVEAEQISFEAKFVRPSDIDRGVSGVFVQLRRRSRMLKRGRAGLRTRPYKSRYTNAEC